MSRKQASHFSRKLKDLQARANGKGTPESEGKWRITFTFDGKHYEKTHRLSVEEVNHMKSLCKEFGDEAASQVIWRAAIVGVGKVSEILVAQAGLDYVRKHYNGPIKIGTVKPQITSYETLAQLEQFAESRKPLPDSEAFSETAAEAIERESLGEKL